MLSTPDIADQKIDDGSNPSTPISGETSDYSEDPILEAALESGDPDKLLTVLETWRPHKSGATITTQSSPQEANPE